MLYNEVKPITILMSEKNKNKNLRQDCKNTGYIKGLDGTEYYTPEINKTTLAFIEFQSYTFFDFMKLSFLK